MIRPLRVRHRRMLSLLAVLVPIGFAAAIAARPEWPGAASAPPLTEVALEPDWLSSESWRVEPLALDVTLFSHARSTDSANSWSLALRPRVDPRRPDLLVYWSPSGRGGDLLPEDARLVGSLAGVRERRLLLSSEGRPGGVLFFYSLAHDEVAAVSPIPEG